MTACESSLFLISSQIFNYCNTKFLKAQRMPCRYRLPSLVSLLLSVANQQEGFRGEVQGLVGVTGFFCPHRCSLASLLEQLFKQGTLEACQYNKGYTDALNCYLWLGSHYTGRAGGMVSSGSPSSLIFRIPLLLHPMQTRATPSCGAGQHSVLRAFIRGQVLMTGFIKWNI